MEMELEARPEGAQFALRSSDYRLRKSAGVAYANNAPPARIFSYDSQ
jgi:hypothetical protein